MHPTNWTPGLVVLGLGLLAGFFFAWRVARGRNPSGNTSGEATDAVSQPDAALATRRDDLLARRDAVFASLRELGSSPAAVEERRRLELEAANILRALDQINTTVPAGTPNAPPAGNWAKGLAWSGGAVAFAVVLALLLSEFSGERGEGGSMTGNTSFGGGTPMAADPEEDPRLAKLEQLAAAHPDMLEFKLDLSQAYLLRDRLIESFEISKEVLEKDPGNARATTYQAVVRMAMGQVQRASEMLDEAVQTAPDLTEAWVQRALVALQSGRFDVAVESLEKALEQRPDGAEVLSPILERARAARDGRLPEANTVAAQARPPASGELPPGHPPTGRPPAHPADPHPVAKPAVSGPAVHGVLDLPDELLGKYPRGTTIFLVARPAEQAGGPPAAVKRLQLTTFPLPFSLSGADTMAGAAFPEKVDIEARIDLDGEAMTRDPSEPVGRVQGVAAGTKDVRVVMSVP